MLALKGIIQGNTVVVEGEDIRAYEGNDAIVTILDFPYGEKKRGNIDLDKFVIPTDRGQSADEYVRGLRDNDRV